MQHPLPRIPRREGTPRCWKRRGGYPFFFLILVAFVVIAASGLDLRSPTRSLKKNLGSRRDKEGHLPVVSLRRAFGGVAGSPFRLSAGDGVALWQQKRGNPSTNVVAQFFEGMPEERLLASLKRKRSASVAAWLRLSSSSANGQGQSQDQEPNQGGGATSAAVAGRRRPKLALVFLVDEHLEFERLWELYLRAEEGNGERFTIMVSAQRPTLARQRLSPFFRDRLVDSGVPSHWCHLTRKQLALAKLALREDPTWTHLVWVSADAIPLKRLDLVFAGLEGLQEERDGYGGKGGSGDRVTSFFCTEEGEEEDDLLLDPGLNPRGGSSPRRRPPERAEMWNVLHRQHVALLSENQEALFKMFGLESGHEDERICEDEQMFLGPLAWLGLGKQLQRGCTTWTDWPEEKKGFHTQLAGLLDSVDSNVTVKSGGNLAHPFTFQAVPAEGMAKLLAAPGAWFARKFRNTAAARTTPTGKSGVAEVVDEGTRSRGNLEDWLVFQLGLAPEGEEFRWRRTLKARRRSLRALSAAVDGI